MRRLSKIPEARRALYAAYVQKLHDLHPPNREYVLRRVNDWVGYRERESALERAAEALVRGEVAEHDLIVRKALESGIPEEDAGLEYLVEHDGIYQRDWGSPTMRTGISALDRMIGGYSRGQLVVMLGGYKAGKTWWIVHTVLQALKEGLNVAALTFEVSKDEMEARLDMSLTGRCLDKKLAGQEYEYDAADATTGILRRHRRVRNWLYADRDRTAWARDVLKKRGGRLFVKKWPMGQCSPAMVEQYLNYLEASKGFTADLVTLDYIDIMDLTSLDKKDLRHQLNRGYIWAKGLADDRNCIMVTVSQVTTSALEKRWVHMKDVAEDRRKVGNCDLMMAIGKGPAEEQAHQAGVSVLANRNGPQDCGVMVSQCLDVGRFCLASWLGKKEIEVQQEAAAEAADGKDD